MNPGRLQNAVRGLIVSALLVSAVGVLRSAAPEIETSVLAELNLTSRQIAAGLPLRLSPRQPVPGATYLWLRDGVGVHGPTSQPYWDLDAVRPSDSGNYVLVQTVDGITSTSPVLSISVHPPVETVDRSFVAALPFDGQIYQPLRETDNGGVVLISQNRYVRLSQLGALETTWSFPSSLRMGDVLGATRDGSLLTRNAPYRFRGDGAPAPLPLSTSLQVSAAIGLHDGKILFAQGTKLTRLNADGTVDASFVPPVFTTPMPLNVESLCEDALGRIWLVHHFALTGTPLKVLFRLHPDSTLEIVKPIVDLGSLDAVTLHHAPEGNFAIQETGTSRTNRFTLRDESAATSYRSVAQLDRLSRGFAIDDGFGVIGPSYVGAYPVRWSARDGFEPDPHFSADLRNDAGARAPLAGAQRLAGGDIYAYGEFRSWNGHVSPRLVRLLPASAASRITRVYRSADSSGETLRIRVENPRTATYEWRSLDGQALPAATSGERLELGIQSPAKFGRYQCLVTNETGTVLSEVFQVPDYHLQLAGLAGRGQTGAGEKQLTAGVAVRALLGGGTHGVLFRGGGPALADYGVNGTLADPELQLFDATSRSLELVNDWTPSVELVTRMAQVGLAPYAPGSRDAAFFRTSLTSSGYTTQLRGHDGGTGIGLIEAYDLGNERMADAYFTWGELGGISLRANAGAGEKAAIGGFIVRDPHFLHAPAGRTARVLVRVSGQNLKRYGIVNPLSAFTVNLLRGDGTPVDSWRTADAETVRLLELDPELPQWSRIYDLPPGAYTASVSSYHASAEGIVLLEIYRVP